LNGPTPPARRQLPNRSGDDVRARQHPHELLESLLVQQCVDVRPPLLPAGGHQPQSVETRLRGSLSVAPKLADEDRGDRLRGAVRFDGDVDRVSGGIDGVLGDSVGLDVEASKIELADEVAACVGPASQGRMPKLAESDRKEPNVGAQQVVLDAGEPNGTSQSEPVCDVRRSLAGDVKPGLRERDEVRVARGGDRDDDVAGVEELSKASATAVEAREQLATDLVRSGEPDVAEEDENSGVALGDLEAVLTLAPDRPRPLGRTHAHGRPSL